jgi:hypothetical protein
MDVVVWLRSLGLGKYEAAFRENEIEESVDLKVGFHEPELFARSRARTARSLTLAQRLVQPLNFAAVEALIPDLKVRAVGFRRL